MGDPAMNRQEAEIVAEHWQEGHQWDTAKCVLPRGHEDRCQTPRTAMRKGLA